MKTLAYTTITDRIRIIHRNDNNHTTGVMDLGFMGLTSSLSALAKPLDKY